MQSAIYTVEEAPGGFAVCRDGRALETPLHAPLIVPTVKLAEAIAEEARGAGRSGHALMPFTQMASAAIDVIPRERADTVGRIKAYVESELLCHRAGHPPKLAKEQQKIWQPLLDWCAHRFSAPLKTGTGVMPIAQPPESLQALRGVIEDCDDFHLAGLGRAVGACGSLVLGLALAARHLAAEQVFHAAVLDVTHQMEKWGDDFDTHARLESIRREVELCGQWFGLLRAGTT